MIQPRLRFNKFHDTWTYKLLNKIAKITMGQSPLSKNYTHNPNYYLLVQGNADLLNGHIHPRLFTKQITKISHKGNIILTVRAPVGDTAINDYGDLVVGRGVANIRGNRFLYELFNRIQLLKHWNRYSTGSTFDSINSKILKNLNIIVPSLLEQRAIGKFFAKLDKLIQLQQKKVSLLKKLKRGYLQKLFRNRNKNFISLDKLCDIKTGNKNANENIPNGKYPFFDRSTEVKHLNTYDYNEETIIYAGEGEQFLPRYFNGKYSLHQRAYSLYNFKKDIVNVIYLYEFLLTQSHRFIRYAVGSTVKSLRMDCFKHIYIPIIPLKKQNIVGEFLLQLSILIKLHSLKITYLRKLKKAYLQKMFC